MTFRRLAITGAIIILDKGSVIQYTAGLMLCFAAACMQASYQPYRELSENRMALGVETNLVAVLYLSFLSGLDTSSFQGDNGNGIGVLFVVLTVVYVGAGVLLVIYEIFYASPAIKNETLFLRRNKSSSKAPKNHRSSSSSDLEMTAPPGVPPEKSIEATNSTLRVSTANKSQKSNAKSRALSNDSTFVAHPVRVPALRQNSSTFSVTSPLQGGADGDFNELGLPSPVTAAGRTKQEEVGDQRKSEHHIRMSGMFKAAGAAVS